MLTFGYPRLEEATGLSLGIRAEGFFRAFRPSVLKKEGIPLDNTLTSLYIIFT
jgi:hypothetical protein